MDELKQLARDQPYLDSRTLIGQAVNDLPAFAAVKMPSMQSMKKTVQRTQRLHDPIGLAQPLSLDQLDLPDDFVELPNGERFLLHDSGPETGNDRYIGLLLCKSLW